MLLVTELREKQSSSDINIANLKKKKQRPNKKELTEEKYLKPLLMGIYYYCDINLNPTKTTFLLRILIDHVKN